jgi:ABC-type branched-subunit amino acid transport system permease subunit
MTILGGMGYFWGPPVGAAALVWLNQEITDYTQYWSFAGRDTAAAVRLPGRDRRDR